jgi:hypothetical protein
MLMDALPEAVREKVQRLSADLITGLLLPENTVWLACDLLMAGVETPAVVELAGESPTQLTLGDAVPLVRQVLAELGVEPVDTTQAAWVVARGVARQMITGDLPPEDGAATLWGLWWACDTALEIGRMLEPLEAWQDTLPKDRDDEAIRAEMRRLAPAVIRAADVRLAVDETPNR